MTPRLDIGREAPERLSYRHAAIEAGNTAAALLAEIRAERLGWTWAELTKRDWRKHEWEIAR